MSPRNPPLVSPTFAGGLSVDRAALQRALGPAAWTVWRRLLWRRNEDGLTRCSRASLVGLPLDAWMTPTRRPRQERTLSPAAVGRGWRRLRVLGLLTDAPIPGFMIVWGDYRDGQASIPRDVVERLATILRPLDASGIPPVLDRLNMPEHGLNTIQVLLPRKSLGSGSIEDRKCAYDPIKILSGDQNPEDRILKPSRGRDGGSSCPSGIDGAEGIPPVPSAARAGNAPAVPLSAPAAVEDPDSIGDVPWLGAAEAPRRAQDEREPATLSEAEVSARWAALRAGERLRRALPPLASGLEGEVIVGGVQVLPPRPSASVLGVARLPSPPELPPEPHHRRDVRWLALALEGASLRELGAAAQPRRHPDPASPRGQTLSAAAEALRAARIPPASWALFSVQVWRARASATMLPPEAWVWSAARIKSREGWYDRGAEVLGGVHVRGPAHDEATARWTKAAHAVRAATRLSPLDQARIAAEILGPDWRELIARAQLDSRAAQARITAQAARGEWVW